MAEESCENRIMEALKSVEHPAISTTLLDLGMLRKPEVAPDGKVILTLALPFPNVPDNVRDYLIDSLAAAVNSAGGELAEVKLAIMSEEQRQIFLLKEQQHWRY